MNPGGKHTFSCTVVDYLGHKSKAQNRLISDENYVRVCFSIRENSHFELNCQIELRI